MNGSSLAKNGYSYFFLTKILPMYKNPQNPTQSTNVLMTLQLKVTSLFSELLGYLLLSYLDLKSMYQSNGVRSGCPVGPHCGELGFDADDTSGGTM